MTFHGTNDKDDTLLAQAISSIKTSHFTSCLVSLLQQTVSFDFAVMLGYRNNKRPVYLFDSITDRRNLLFECYLTQAFQHDPFFSLISDHRQDGVYHITDIACDNASLNHYQKAFYNDTQWQDEVCLTLQVSESSWVSLFLGSRSQKSFSASDIERLNQRFPVVQALCKQHWDTTVFSLPQHNASPHSLITAVHESLNSFGQVLLSEREQQITALLLQGFDSEDIAHYFSITHGTVKNHRKNIYKKLAVTSLSELFQLFLQHLMAGAQT